MKRFPFLALFAAYTKKRSKFILAYCLFIIIFAVVFSLYSLPLYAVEYAVLLCAVTASMFILHDFWKYSSHHKKLCDMLNNISIGLDSLPEANDLIEQDYQDLLAVLYEEKIKIAFQSDKNKTEMLDYYTLWAHQIKTPIFAMRLLLQEESSEHNTAISLELLKIEQYADMVLQYQRFESISSDLTLEQYNLSVIVKQAIKKYAPLFIQKKIKLEFRESDCLVFTDEKWLLFVVEQILSNALKYTSKGTISIYISDKELMIEDTGIGISEENLPRIFERGFTGYNGRMDKRSTGIGLYLCKQILTRLSHTINITSEVGVGTKVLIGFSSNDIWIE